MVAYQKVGNFRAFFFIEEQRKRMENWDSTGPGLLISTAPPLFITMSNVSQCTCNKVLFVSFRPFDIYVLKKISLQHYFKPHFCA